MGITGQNNAHFLQWQFTADVPQKILPQNPGSPIPPPNFLTSPCTNPPNMSAGMERLPLAVITNCFCVKNICRQIWELFARLVFWPFQRQIMQKSPQTCKSNVIELRY